MKQKIDLSNYTTEELIELHNMIKERFAFIQQKETYKALSKLCVGDKVTFKTYEGRTVIGTITRLNKKSVSLVEDNNKMGWKVQPSLLSKVRASKREADSNNILEFHAR